MCGISGIFAYHAAATAPDEAELLATRDAMRARGPDGSGAWWSADRRCGLGHRRLAILDLSDRASQPMASADGKIVVTFNGEIYNYRAAARRTRSGRRALPDQFRYGSASASLCARRRGDGAPAARHVRLRHLGREAARAVSRSRPLRHQAALHRKRRLDLPLRLAGQGAARRRSRCRATPSRQGSPAFICSAACPNRSRSTATFAPCRPGTRSGSMRRGRASLDLSPTSPQSSPKVARSPAPAAELPERLRAAARDSVDAHLLADVEVGIFLSAGVDSGALLGLMADAGQRETRAITLAFDEYRGTAEDEAPLAGRVAARYGAQHIVRRVDEREFREDLPAIIAAMDQPSIDGVNTWFVAKAAKEAGLKVALSGLGGDELLAGYPSFVDLPRWRRRFGPFAMVPGLGRVARPLIRALAPGFASARPKALGLLEYADSWAGAYLLRRGLFLPA